MEIFAARAAEEQKRAGLSGGRLFGGDFSEALYRISNQGNGSLLGFGNDKTVIYHEISICKAKTPVQIYHGHNSPGKIDGAGNNIGGFGSGKFEQLRMTFSTHRQVARHNENNKAENTTIFSNICQNPLQRIFQFAG